MTRTRTMPTTITWALALAAAAAAAAAQPAQPEEAALRADLESRLDGVAARIPAGRGCAPTPTGEVNALVAMIRNDLARSPLRAARIEGGIRQLDDYVGYLTSAGDVTCGQHQELLEKLNHSAEVRNLAHGRLAAALTSVQSSLPASPRQLKAVFSAPHCYYPRSHTTTTTICLFEGTPFDALRKFVMVDDEGKIRARYGLRLGHDRMTEFFREDGGTILYRDHSNATIRNSVHGFVFGSKAMRKTLKWSPKSMRNSVLASLYSRLRWLPRLDAASLPRLDYSSMRSTSNGNSGSSSPVTVAGVYVSHLVDAARHHAAATCAATVLNGARLAKAFNSNAPADREAARLYADAARLVRAEVENIAATGAEELCDRRHSDMRALVDQALGRVRDSAEDVDTSLYEDALREEKEYLRVYAKEIRRQYFSGVR